MNDARSIPLSIVSGVCMGGVVLLFFSRVSARSNFHHFIVYASILLFMVGAGSSMLCSFIGSLQQSLIQIVCFF